MTGVEDVGSQGRIAYVGRAYRQYRKSERGPVSKESHVLWNDDCEEIGKSVKHTENTLSISNFIFYREKQATRVQDCRNQACLIKSLLTCACADNLQHLQNTSNYPNE